MATANKQTKVEVVREVLKEVGALSKNPPQGWANLVQEELVKRKVKVHKSAIYSLRTKALNIKGSRGRRKKGAAHSTAFDTSSPILGFIEDARLLRGLAEKYGSWEALVEVINCVAQLG